MENVAVDTASVSRQSGDHVGFEDNLRCDVQNARAAPAEAQERTDTVTEALKVT